MNITRWDPFREMEDISSRLNRMFGKGGIAAPWSSGEAMAFPDWAPSVDVVETAEEFQIKAELPGVKKEDVKVNVENGMLSISGERKHEREEKGKKFHRIERSYGSFMRSFTLPENIDAAKLHAEYKDGLLNIRLPKTEVQKPKAIEVEIK